MEHDSKAKKIIKAAEKAKSNMGAFPALWRETADYVRPVKSAMGMDTNDSPRRERLEQLFDTSTIEANQTYAAGCMSWMTPSESVWFSYDPPEWLKRNDGANSWLSTCTDITQQILAKSNFYQSIHELYLDDGGFGTSGILTREGGLNGLTFQQLEIGTYAIAEDEEGNVDTVYRFLELTHRQAAQRFGRENLSERAREDLDSGKTEEKLTYIHFCGRRDDAERDFGKIDAENMPYASIYVDAKHKIIVKESGSWEMSIAVHRHAKWGRSPYGFSPAIQSLVDSRQLNSMQELLDALVEKQVTPPILVPGSYKGKVDLMAGGYTYFKSGEEKPQFWNNPGNYLVGEDRVEFRKNQINKAFHVDLFQALASVPPGKEMTASEVIMRQRDRLTLFSPTFARKNTELNTPIMMRVFSILLRAGAFPPPPKGMLVQDPVTGFRTIPTPEISYTSRLALQMKAIKNEAYMRALEMIMPMAQVQPDIMDHFNSDEIVRGIMRNEGVNETWIRTQQEVEEMRFERAKAMAEQEQRQAQLEESQVASNLSKTHMLAEAA